VLNITKKKLFAAILLIVLAINIGIFITAYPRTVKPLDQTFAADFSAYYIGEWRLFHNPTKIYWSGDYLPGDVEILPKPQTFMYTPSFLVFFAPFLSLDYQTALAVFDFVQLLSIFALTFFLYKMLKDKDPILGAIAAVIILVLPIPNLFGIGAEYTFPSYYWGYALGNAHVIQTALIGAALYFGFAKKPWLSAFMVMASCFDPRVTLLAIPILVWYNRGTLRKFILASIGFIAAFNLPFFFYENIGLTFLEKRVKGDIITAMYAYDWLPLVAVATITVVEAVTIIAAKKGYNFPKLRKT
jgi:hypothetical protein